MSCPIQKILNDREDRRLASTGDYQQLRRNQIADQYENWCAKHGFTYDKSMTERLAQPLNADARMELQQLEDAWNATYNEPQSNQEQ